jgi:uridine kinase
MTGNTDGGFRAESIALATEVVELMTDWHALGALDVRGLRTVIAVAGESGSGKSVTSLCLASELDARGLRTEVLHQDDYFHRPPATNHFHRVRDLSSVGPQEVNFALLRSHVATFRAGENGVVTPCVDYPNNRFLTRQRDFASVAVLIVEGTYVLAHVQSDIRIFLAATSDETRERRCERNRDIDAPIVDRVLAIEHPIIAAQAELTDILIDQHFRIVRA